MQSAGMNYENCCLTFYRDMLDLMLSEHMRADPSSSFYGDTGYYTILNDYIELFVAGMETTASSLMWSFIYLLHHPGKIETDLSLSVRINFMIFSDIQAKVHAEIDEVVGSDRLPSLDDRNEMHYTQAFLLESMR